MKFLFLVLSFLIAGIHPLVWASDETKVPASDGPIEITPPGQDEPSRQEDPAPDHNEPAEPAPPTPVGSEGQ